MKRSIDSARSGAQASANDERDVRGVTSAIRPARGNDPEPAARHKPSGVHRIDRPATEPAAELDAHGQPVSVIQELTYRAQPKRSSSPSLPPPAAARFVITPHLAPFATAQVAVVMSGLLVACHWVLAAAWAHVLLALSPLLFLVPTARAGVTLAERAQRGLYAGLLWLALAWAELVRPSEPVGSLQLQRLVALFVLAAILLRLQKAYGSMHELGRRDPLTGLLNRRGLDELGSAELRRAERYDRPLAFALLDVDRFKEVNDRFGHAAGDRVLKLVAEQLMQLRHSDLPVRLGGDEFGLLMPETDLEGAEFLVARLQQSIEECMAEQGFPVTVSVGIASGPSGLSMEKLIAVADREMYAAKGTIALR
jgi:diguanylate cyclase (GGDEF)-like protein